VGRSVLVVGGGGREHALAWRLAGSPSVDRVACAPGNPGTAELGPAYALDPDDPEAVVAVAERIGCDLVVVGPEGPLVAGVVDALASRGIAVFGPRRAAAAIEGSKAFAKDVMAAAGVATAAYLATADRDEAHAALDGFRPPYVVKADGLAAGKGVRICEGLEEARAAIDDVLVHRRFGAAGTSVVLEEFLTGPERSVFGICDGRDVVLLAPAQDHKRAFDGDLGPNTGGMGAFTPVPGFGLDAVSSLRETVFLPVLRELERRGAPFRGLLYAGVIVTDTGPSLLEFNARFGDPETQVILPRLASDLGDLLAASATGSVTDLALAWHERSVATVVLTSAGYPEQVVPGHPISGLEAVAAAPDTVVFHAGTARRDDGRIVTAGGRVLDVTAWGADLAEARDRAYAAVERLGFEGMQFRRDIAG
jgi:phosphoribosylamine---glycine ligase